MNILRPIFLLIFLSSSSVLNAQEKDDSNILKNNYHIVYFKTVATLNELATIKSKVKQEISILKYVVLKDVKLKDIANKKFLIGKGILSKQKTDWQADRTVMIKWESVTSIIGFNNYEAFQKLTRNYTELKLGN